MFKNLLIPLDLTDKHEAVLDSAVALAQRHGAAITLLHVIEAIAGFSVDEEKRFYDQLERASEKHLGNHVRDLKDRGITCAHKILIGNRARAIAAFAADIGADLILLTAPSFDPANPAAGFASLSYKVSLLAQCPVLLVKPLRSEPLTPSERK